MSNSFGLPLLAGGAAMALWLTADSLRQQARVLRQFREDNIRLLRGADRDLEPPAPSGVRVLALPPMDGVSQPAVEAR